MSREFRIYPLSEGFGLGSLKTPTHTKMTRERDVLPTIEIQQIQPQHIPHDIYRRESTGAKLKKAPKARARLWVAQTLVGWGLDAFMVCMTLMMSAILGTMAWRFGSGATHAMDPIDALKTIAQFVSMRGINVIGGGVLIAWIIYWIVMKALVGSTFGASLTRPR